MGDDSQARLDALEARVEQLEAELDRVRRSTAEPSPAATPRATTAEWGAPGQQPASWPAPVASPEVERTPFQFDSEAALKWGGVGLVVLAVGFAVSTAISRGWIGPELQLAGAIAIAAALIVTGIRLQPTRPAWTHALCSGGVLALYITFASNLFLEQANDEIASVCVAVAVIVGFALAWQISSEWVGAATVLGGLIAWFVIGDGEPPVMASTGFVVAVVGIGIAIAINRHWFALRLATHGAGIVALAGLTETPDRTFERVVVVAAASLLAASLVRVPSIGDLRSIWQQLEVQLVAVTAPWALTVVAVSADLDSDTTVGATAILIAVGAALVAVALRRWNHPAHHVSILLGASVTLSIGLAILLSAAVAFTAIAVQGAGLVVLARTLGDNVRVFVNAAIASVIAGGFALIGMLQAWDDDATIGDDIAHIAIIVALAVAAWQTGNSIVHRVGALVVLALTLVWTGSVLVHVPQGQAAVSVSWAVIGTAVLVAGAIRRRPEVAYVGLAVLGLTVAKLLTVDLQEVDALWRAGLFFLVGLGFLRLGFLLPRLTGADETADGHD